MSSQFTNNYATTPTSPNSYVSRKLNNMEEAQVMKKEQNNWTRLYHKTLKGIKMIIDVQKMVKNMKKIAEMANTMIMEIKGSITIVSINNWTMNTINILGISEDLQYLIQSNIKDQSFQVQRILADKLDRYKGKGNSYVDKNI